MNRILYAIEKKRESLQGRLDRKEITKERLQEVSAALDVGEYYIFQERKTLAVAQGRLTSEEGQTVYALLGNVPTTFNKQDVAVKAVLTSLFRELLGG